MSPCCAIDSLETRALLSNFDVSVVDNINTIDKYPSQLTPAGTNLFYTVADSANTGQELMVTTAGGTTTALADFSTAGTVPTSLTAAGNDVYFLAGSDQSVLWTSDGTSAGTKPIAFSDPGDADSTEVTALATTGSTLYFVSEDPTSSSYGDDLWSLTAGSTTPTLVQADIEIDGAVGSLSNVTPVGSTLYFTVSSSGSPNPVSDQLWETNGTPDSAAPVNDIDNVNSIVDFNGANAALYYLSGGELYSYSSQSGPQPISDANGDFTVAGSDLFFVVSASDGNAAQVWVTTGTAPGTEQVSDFTGSNDDTPGNLTNLGGTVYFTEPASSGYYQLWKSDESGGTISGTSLVTDLTTPVPPQTADSAQSTNSYGFPGLQAVGGTLYFANGDSTHGTELWSVSNTSAPAMVNDIDPGIGGLGAARSGELQR